jgi:hypothetical protein
VDLGASFTQQFCINFLLYLVHPGVSFRCATTICTVVFFANHAGSSDAAEQKIIMPKVYELDIPLLYHFIELLVRTLGE